MNTQIQTYICPCLHPSIRPSMKPCIRTHMHTYVHISSTNIYTLNRRGPQMAGKASVRFMVLGINGCQVGNNHEGQPVGSSFLCCCPHVVWRVQRCFRLRLANPRIAMSGAQSSSHASVAAAFVCKLNSTRPFHSFGPLSRVFAKVQKFLSVTVTVDPSLYICMSLCRRSIGTFALATSWRLRFEDRAFPFSVLTCGSISAVAHSLPTHQSIRYVLCRSNQAEPIC